MIGKLHGVAWPQEPGQLLVDVNGVGYEVFVPMSLYASIQPGQVQDVWISTLMRAESLSLYGFASTQDKLWFLTLMKVNGVGAKMALAVMSVFDFVGFCQAVHHKSVTALTKVPGIGKKTAERMLVELSDKLPIVGDEVMAGSSETPASGDSLVAMTATAVEPSAVAALMSLGYTEKEAKAKVKKAADQADEALDLQTWIKLALQA